MADNTSGGHSQHRGGRGGANFRGRGGVGGGHRGDRGGRGGGYLKSQQSGEVTERPKKENILDLSKYLHKEIRAKFAGGREVTGILKGYDQLMNLVLDEVKETMRDEAGNEKTRSLGFTVARGTMIVLIAPTDGSEEIANPFAPPQEE